MRKNHFFTLAGIIFLFFIVPFITYGVEGGLPLRLIDFAENQLAAYGRDPIIVSSVKAQNQQNIPLSRVQEIDNQWKNYPGVNRFMLEKISNECALALWNIEIEYPFIVETFVMDNQGANVGQTRKTSDYWQGDESKFTESYKNETGAIHYGDIEYDPSVDEIIVQISVPVMDNSKAIGAITFGISLDRWERR